MFQGSLPLLQVKTTLDSMSQKIAAFTDVGNSLAHVQHLLKDLTAFEEKSSVSIGHGWKGKGQRSQLCLTMWGSGGRTELPLEHKLLRHPKCPPPYQAHTRFSMALCLTLSLSLDFQTWTCQVAWTTQHHPESHDLWPQKVLRIQWPQAATALHTIAHLQDRHQEN